MTGREEQIDAALEAWLDASIRYTDWRLIRERRLIYEMLSGNHTASDGIDADQRNFSDLPSTIQPRIEG